MSYKPRKASSERLTFMWRQECKGTGEKATERSSLGRGAGKCKCPMMEGLKNSQKASVTRVEQKEGM